jgi:hypothetical protein
VEIKCAEGNEPRAIHMQPPPPTINTHAIFPTLDCIIASLFSGYATPARVLLLALLLCPLVAIAAEWVALPIEEPGSAAKLFADRASAKFEPPWVFVWVKRDVPTPCEGVSTGGAAVWNALPEEEKKLCFRLGTEWIRGEISVFSWMRRYALNCKERTFAETASKTYDYQNRPISDESYSRYQWEPKARDISPDSLPESLFDMFCRSASTSNPAPTDHAGAGSWHLVFVRDDLKESDATLAYRIETRLLSRDQIATSAWVKIDYLRPTGHRYPAHSFGRNEKESFSAYPNDKHAVSFKGLFRVRCETQVLTVEHITVEAFDGAMHDSPMGTEGRPDNHLAASYEGA